MSGDSVVVRRRSRAETARLASSYPASGLSRSEFCWRHGLALNTLNRYLKKHAEQPQQQKQRRNDGVGLTPRVEVALAAEGTLPLCQCISTQTGYERSPPSKSKRRCPPPAASPCPPADRNREHRVCTTPCRQWAEPRAQRPEIKYEFWVDFSLPGFRP